MYPAFERSLDFARDDIAILLWLQPHVNLLDHAKYLPAASARIFARLAQTAYK